MLRILESDWNTPTQEKHWCCENYQGNYLFCKKSVSYNLVNA